MKTLVPISQSDHRNSLFTSFKGLLYVLPEEANWSHSFVFFLKTTSPCPSIQDVTEAFLSSAVSVQVGGIKFTGLVFF